MISTQYVKLNMVPSGVLPVLYCSQYDIGRPLGMTVYNGGEAVDLDGYTCTIEATRTDGTAITAAVTTDNNIGAFVTTATMTNQADKYPAKLVLFDSNSRRVASLAFILCVTPAAMDENAESIEEDKSLYQQYTGTVQTIIAQIRGDLVAEITARQNAISAEASARQAADNTLQSNINAEVSARATQAASLQSQIDQLVAPSGEAPSAAEVENARIGSDGTVYPTLGDAIRTQNSLLKSQLDDIASRFVTGKNLLDPDKVSTGIIISAADGRTEPNASYNTSDFIPISIGQSITISPNCRKFLAYGSAKVAIQNTYIDAGVNTAYTYTATENGFIRITYLATNGQEQVEYGSVASSYEPYQLSIANDIDLSDDQKYYINNAIDAVLVPVESDVDHICQKTVGDNIYDPSTPLTTGWLTSSGIVDATGTGANFATTDFIHIEEDTDYVVANVRITQSANIGSRILIALYDSAHNYIANTFQNVANVTPMQVTFNSGNAAFLRVSTLPAHMGSNPTSEWRLYIGEGTTSPSVYIPYSVVYYNRMIIQPGYGALTEEDLSGIRETVKSKNIYDASKPLTTGWIEGVHGTVDATGTGANFATTDFIPVEKNTAYIIANERMNTAGDVIGSRILMALYDANQYYIPNTFQNVINANPMQVTFNSGDAVYLRVSTLPMHMGENPTSDFALIVQKGSALDGYTTYWERKVSVLNPSAVSASDNILFGKKYVACGDSLTAGDFTGYVDAYDKTGVHSDAFSPEYGTYKTYPYWIALRNGMTLVNSGINGSTMAISKEYIDGTESSINFRSPFSYQRYKDIPADADYITIWFGVNDSSHTYLGTIDDADNTTFYGAWNVVLPYLVEHHPNAKIGIVITFGIPDSPYTVAVRQIAKKWGIPFYDFAQGEQSPIIIRNKDTGYAVDSDMVDLRLTQFRVAVDNNHPNVQAHKFESTCLEAWMRSL